MKAMLSGGGVLLPGVDRVEFTLEELEQKC